MTPISNLPELDEKREKKHRRGSRVEHVLRRSLHIIEQVIAVVTLVLLILSLAAEIMQTFRDPTYFTDAGKILHNLLSIVVGLEFVRMLIDTTPANILEVLTVAITRHVILSHDDPWSNVACIACIAGLFAIRRFLIPRNELAEEMVEE